MLLYSTFLHSVKMVGKRYFEQQDDDDEVESSEPEPTPAKKPKKAHQTDRDVDNADG